MDNVSLLEQYLKDQYGYGSEEIEQMTFKAPNGSYIEDVFSAEVYKLEGTLDNYHQWAHKQQQCDLLEDEQLIEIVD